MKVTWNPETQKYEPEFDPATRDFFDAMSTVMEKAAAAVAAKFGMTPRQLQAHVHAAMSEAVHAIATAAQADGRIPLEDTEATS